MTNSVYTTREEWLTAAAALLEPLYETTPATVRPVRVSVGFPSGSRGRNKAIGQCHYAAADEVPQVFIHPVLTDPVRVLDVLGHELAHAYLPVGTGHRGDFVRVVRALGLDGPATATTAGPEFATVAGLILETIGDYPHASLDTSSLPKQSTRMVKVECSTCGLIYRASRKVLDSAAEVGCCDRDCDGPVDIG